MEKLIELLNEYFDKDGIFKAIGHNDRLEIFDLEVKDDFVRDETVISKKFGFIKWLVEQDKIEIPIILDELPQLYGVDYDSKESKSDRLIMLLSISTNPISDLVSYLK